MGVEQQSNRRCNHLIIQDVLEYWLLNDGWLLLSSSSRRRRCIDGVCVDRDREPVLRRPVHGRDADETVQSRSPWLRRVAVQSFRLFRRRVQHRRGGADLHARHAAARRQRVAMCQAAARLQGHTVSASSTGD